MNDRSNQSCDLDTARGILDGVLIGTVIWVVILLPAIIYFRA